MSEALKGILDMTLYEDKTQDQTAWLAKDPR